jgi:hypothetical protein
LLQSVYSGSSRAGTSRPASDLTMGTTTLSRNARRAIARTPIARDGLRAVHGCDPALEHDHAERKELAGVVLERGQRLMQRGGDRRLEVLPHKRVHVLADRGAVSVHCGPTRARAAHMGRTERLELHELGQRHGEMRQCSDVSGELCARRVSRGRATRHIRCSSRGGWASAALFEDGGEMWRRQARRTVHAVAMRLALFPHTL